MARKYASSSAAHNAATILSEIALAGKSTGWAGSHEDLEALKVRLRPFNVRYVDDILGEWALTGWNASAIAGVLNAADYTILNCTPGYVSAASGRVDANAQHDTIVAVRLEDGEWLTRAQHRGRGWSAPEDAGDPIALLRGVAAALAAVVPDGV